MADPKITLEWQDNNADETGHRILSTSSPWSSAPPAEQIKEVAADVTTVDLALTEVAMEPAFLKVAAVRGTDVKVSKESALAIKHPVIPGPLFKETYSRIGGVPNGETIPDIVAGSARTFSVAGSPIDFGDGYTVTPDGLLLQIDNAEILTFNPATGVSVTTPLTTGLSRVGAAVCMASDGNAYCVGRALGNTALFRYKMDGEQPEVVHQWPYGSGPGSELSPSAIKQGVDGRLYMFGGSGSITAANEMVVNSIGIDGSAPRTDVIALPVAVNNSGLRYAMAANGKIVAWAPGDDAVLVYDPAASLSPTVIGYGGNTDLNSGTEQRPTTRRIWAPCGASEMFVMGNGPNVCRFMFENNARVSIIAPAEFVEGKPVREIFDSGMGWTFLVNVVGDIYACHSKGDGVGTLHTAVSMGLDTSFGGVSVFRVGKKVYAAAQVSEGIRIFDFTIDSAWQSTGPYDAASIINTHAVGTNK